MKEGKKEEGENGRARSQAAREGEQRQTQTAKKKKKSEGGGREKLPPPVNDDYRMQQQQGRERTDSPSSADRHVHTDSGNA